MVSTGGGDVSPRKRPESIDAQVRRVRADPVKGRWFRAVLDAFAYLETDFDFRLAEIFEHFRGDGVRHGGPGVDVVLSFDPDDTGRVGASLWFDETSTVIELNDLLRARDAAVLLPDVYRTNTRPGDAVAAQWTWATELRRLAADVLRGEWRPDSDLR